MIWLPDISSHDNSSLDNSSQQFGHTDNSSHWHFVPQTIRHTDNSSQDIWSHWQIVTRTFRQMTFCHKTFRHIDISSHRHFVTWHFVTRLFVTRHFVTRTFCHTDISSHKNSSLQSIVRWNLDFEQFFPFVCFIFSAAFFRLSSDLLHLLLEYENWKSQQIIIQILNFPIHSCKKKVDWLQTNSHSWVKNLDQIFFWSNP